jgi:hypothetical protein
MGEIVMKKKISGLRALVLAAVATGGAMAPTPAVAGPLSECFASCYLAYVVMTQQPLFYAQCRDICIRDNIPLVYAPEIRTPLGIIRHG